MVGTILLLSSENTSNDSVYGLLKRVSELSKTLVSKGDRQLADRFKLITGRFPVNLGLYKQSLRHSSVAQRNTHGIKDSYERLEYLGDAILGMVVAEYLFARFPYKEEGFLTELRARIVSREALNHLSRKIGLAQLVQFSRHRGPRHKSVYGDALEALVGAVYLDQGFLFARTFIIRKLIQPHYDIEELINTTYNHKSKIIEWAQKENRQVAFELLDDPSESNGQFIVQVMVDGEPIEIGHGFNKKKAEQDAARRSLGILNVEE